MEQGREDEAARRSTSPVSSEGGSPPAHCRCPAETWFPLPPKGPGLPAGEEPLTGDRLLLVRGLPVRPLRLSLGGRGTQSPPNQS